MREPARSTRCLWPHCRKPQKPGSIICPTHTTPRRGRDAVALHLLIASYPDAVQLAAVLHLGSLATRRMVARLTAAGHTIEHTADGWLYVLPRLPAPQERLGKYRRAMSATRL